MNDTPVYPRRVRANDTEFELRLMQAGDEKASLDFANALSPHDLLFLQRDIRNPKVVAAWIDQINRGLITSILALKHGTVVGCAAIVRDQLSWSPHVGELRVVVAEEVRGGGIGRELVQNAFEYALSLGLIKLIARMTPDQRGAIAVFEELGFRAEALLRDHVRDAAGVTHDIVILSLNVLQNRNQREMLGYNEV